MSGAEAPLMCSDVLHGNRAEADAGIQPDACFRDRIRMALYFVRSEGGTAVGLDQVLPGDQQVQLTEAAASINGAVRRDHAAAGKVNGQLAEADGNIAVAQQRQLYQLRPIAEGEVTFKIVALPDPYSSLSSPGRL